MLPLFVNYFHAKKQEDIPWLFPELLMIMESCNLIGQEAQLTALNQK